MSLLKSIEILRATDAHCIQYLEVLQELFTLYREEKNPKREEALAAFSAVDPQVLRKVILRFKQAAAKPITEEEIFTLFNQIGREFTNG